MPAGAILPVALRRQQWSPLNVPLLWGVAGVEQSELVFEFLTSIASAIQEPVEFHGSHISASEALRMEEGSHEVVGHQLHRTVDHVVEELRVPRNTSRTPHFCHGAGVHQPQGLHDGRARCIVGSSCVDHFASGVSEWSPTCDEGAQFYARPIST